MRAVILLGVLAVLGTLVGCAGEEESESPQAQVTQTDISDRDDTQTGISDGDYTQTVPAQTGESSATTASVSQSAPQTEETSEQKAPRLLSGPEDIGLTDRNGKRKNYVFTYGKETFLVDYYPDNWTVRDSYKIQNTDDMVIICEALQAEHPIPSADRKGYRTPDDMMYEWVQHNTAYAFLPPGTPWSEHAKDVDFNPDDQGLDLYGFFKDRTQNS